MIQQIDHIGIAVRQLDEHIPFYRDVLQLTLLGTEIVADQKVRVAMFRVGEVKIELLEPTSAESPIAKFIEKKGEGIHHIAYRTDDVKQEIAQIEARELRMVDQTPRAGAHGSLIAFLHPKSSGRVLTELCQKGEDQE